MDYEITTGTLAIFPSDTKNSVVMEKEEEFFISKSPKKLIEYSCEYFGSSFEGRSKGSINILNGASHKLPIIIEETNNIIFFPTLSPSREECIWLSLNHIFKFKENANQETEITFDNGKIVNIPISILSFTNQYSRACQLSAALENRKKQK